MAADVVVNSAGKPPASRAATPDEGADEKGPPLDGWAKLKMESSAQGVPERPRYNPKRPPLKENFFDRENDEEKRQKLLETTKTLIRSQLLSSGKQGVEYDKFVSDYRSFMGDLPPFKKLGFDDLHHLLRSIPDVVTVLNGFDGYILKGVVNEETQRVWDLIAYQKKSGRSRSKKKGGRGGGGVGGGGGRFGGGGGRGGRFGGGGGGGGGFRSGRPMHISGVGMSDDDGFDSDGSGKLSLM